MSNMRKFIHTEDVDRIKSLLEAIDYDGNFEQRRFVINTLDFTMKTNIYGYVSQSGVIKDVTVNTSIPGQKYNAVQDTLDGPITESWEAMF